MIADSRHLIDALWSIGAEEARRLGGEVPERDEAIRQYREDAVFPERVEVRREPGEDYWAWYERQARANGGWRERHDAALADPRNMASAFMARALAKHYAARAGLGLAPWSGAQEAAAREPDWVRQYAAELQRRASND